MKITNTEVYGFESALRGMRNPMNSWHLQDSEYGNEITYQENNHDILSETVWIGEKDMDLAKRLIKGGSEHCKFLRQIQVWADFNLPLYIWSEFDTYKFNTKNSCSTMHKLLNKEKEIELDDFEYDYQDTIILKSIVDQLNEFRHYYLESKNYEYVIRAKKLLPTSFKQLRTVNTNYAELINIYHQRKNHRLKKEWGMICKWIESLPYMKEFIEVG